MIDGTQKPVFSGESWRGWAHRRIVNEGIARWTLADDDLDRPGGGRGAGDHALAWDGRDERGAAAAAGVYFYEARVGAEVGFGKVALVK